MHPPYSDPVDGGEHGTPPRPVAGFPVPERPALPKPERLNRNALTVAAVIMGVLVLAAVVFVQPGRPPDAAAPRSVMPPDVAQGTFLDQPVAQPAGTRPGSVPGASALDSILLSEQSAGYGRPSAHAAGGDPFASDPYGATYATTPAPPATPRPPDPRVEAYRAALAAPLVASAATAQHARMPAAWETFDLQQDAGQGMTPEHAVHGAVAHSPNLGGWSAPSGSGAGVGTSRHQRFVADAARPAATVIRTSVVPAPGPYAIQAGAVLPAVLMTEINSDLPGEVLAQVARDVYDSRTQRAILIPKGSRLLGRYDHQIAVGQDRLLVAWTRVIFPDGRSVSLPGLQTKDRAGAGGLHDRVDNHTRQLFGTATLLSMISAGAQLSQPNAGYGAFGAYPSPGQVAAGAAGQQLAEVAAQMLRRNMDVQPTIRIRQGTPFNVFLNADLTFPAPYLTGR